MARVELLPEAQEDIAGLDGSVRPLIFKKLKKLAANPEAMGHPLGGELTGFRKLVVGDRQYRIVYRVEPNGDIVVVWVVASRVDSHCYELAKARLALHAGDERAKQVGLLLAAAFEADPGRRRRDS